MAIPQFLLDMVEENKKINKLLNRFACDFPRQTTAYEIKELGARLIEDYKKIKECEK